MIRACVVICAGALAAPALADGPAFPFDAVGGAFELIDQTGAARTEVDPDGAAQLLFFGYANCQQICSAVLPQMAEVTDALALAGHRLRPILITVAPETDTVETMGPALAMLHDAFVGLTGTEEALQTAYDAFQVEKEVLFEDPEYGPVYAHGSFLYLLDAAGEVLTMLPPVLPDDELVRVITSYLPAS